MRSSTLFPIVGLASCALAAYVIEDDYEPSTFFSNFDFFTSADPTDGFVSYVDQATAQSGGLINTNNGAVYMGVDYTNVAAGSGRSSVRITSKKSYNHGLVILDLAHMPGGTCGTWPAFWMVGPNWPNSGEIDVIEGVNSQDSNSMTLHTSAGCSITNNGDYSGTMSTPNCNVAAPGQSTNAGCQINTASTSSYGTGFNAQGGGVYATQWTSDVISIWFFPRSSIPSDIASGSPNSANWGIATASFSGGGCDIDDHFMNQQIVFDTTFCGDWAGNVWGSDAVCSPKASTCQAFVQNNPSAFANAYWSVNSLKVYQDNGATVQVIASATSAPSTSVASSQAVSLTPTTATAIAQTTPALAVVGEAGNGSVVVSILSGEDPDAKAVPTSTEESTTATEIASGGVFAQVSSSITAAQTTNSTSLTFTSAITVNNDISTMSLTSTTTTHTAAPLTVTSTLSGAGSFVTVSALDTFDFPSSGETQTAGVPLPARKRHMHRHIIKHQDRKRHRIH